MATPRRPSRRIGSYKGLRVASDGNRRPSRPVGTPIASTTATHRIRHLHRPPRPPHRSRPPPPRTGIADVGFGAGRRGGRRRRLRSPAVDHRPGGFGLLDGVTVAIGRLAPSPHRPAMSAGGLSRGRSDLVADVASDDGRPIDCRIAPGGHRDRVGSFLSSDGQPVASDVGRSRRIDSASATFDP